MRSGVIRLIAVWMGQEGRLRKRPGCLLLAGHDVHSPQIRHRVTYVLAHFRFLKFSLSMFDSPLETREMRSQRTDNLTGKRSKV